MEDSLYLVKKYKRPSHNQHYIGTVIHSFSFHDFVNTHLTIYCKSEGYDHLILVMAVVRLFQNIM